MQKVKKRNKLVYGVGINDADYVTEITETIGFTNDGKRIQKRVWTCVFYKTWVNMLARCYNEKLKTKYPTYKECRVVPEWHYFMTFRKWMEKQDWQGKQLDKDLLISGNKLYSQETCVFVTKTVNSFLTDSGASRGEFPIGVSFHKYIKKYQAQCRDFSTGKYRHLGYYDKAEEAHQVWLEFKITQARLLAAEQTDSRVAKALIERYKNYNERN